MQYLESSLTRWVVLIDITQTLLEGGADPEYGGPSALECVAMFKLEDQWKEKFESASGRGKAGLAR